MMNMLEEAIIYATIMYQGKVRKFKKVPYILHPMEVAQILSTMSDDQELIAAGMLHDVVEDTDGTMEEIRKRFGERVAFLVACESENDYPGEDRRDTWKRRKEESLKVLRNSDDIGVQMLWLADKLANIRSLAQIYGENGEKLWGMLNQSDPAEHCWYYRSVAESLELSLNRTGAFKEMIKHINSIWPGTFDSDKAKFKKYKEVSIEGCKLLGRGAKGDVYRYDDELVIKVYNRNNTYHDVEREIDLCRKTFILGIPTAISFGIVSVGKQYGAMFELLDSATVSSCIAKDPARVDEYAVIMADLAHVIHDITVTKDDGFPDMKETLRSRVYDCFAGEYESLAESCMRLIETIPESDHLVHGDFHSGNVFLLNGEPILIDMDRISTGHPIAELSDLMYFYEILGEDDPEVVENFMGFSYETAKKFFDTFLKRYLNTEDEERINDVKKKASLICYMRLIRKIRKVKSISKEDHAKVEKYLKIITGLVSELDTLEI